MGRNSTLKLMAMKPEHVKELWGMIAGYERPMHSGPASGARNCESCHWPQTEHHDSVAVNKRFATDPKSSEIRLPAAAAHDGGHRAGDPVEGERHPLAHREQRGIQEPGCAGRGDSVDPGHETGRHSVVYLDAESKLSSAEIGKLEPRKMECYNCHNAVGHPFPNPAYRGRHGDCGRPYQP